MFIDIARKVSEGIGWLIGTFLLRPYFFYFSVRSRSYKILGEFESIKTYLGNGEPGIVALNHIGPVATEGKVLWSLGITPDVLIQHTLVKRLTGRGPLIVVINNAEFGMEVDDSLYIQNIKLIRQSFGYGLMSGGGTLPVNKNIDKFGIAKQNTNNDFYVEAPKRLKKGNILTFFVEGTWRRPQYDLTTEFHAKSGAAVIAALSSAELKKQVPIIPIYIHCSDLWDKDTVVHLYSGEAIFTEGKEKHQVNAEIEQSIIALQKKAIQETPNLLETIVRK